MKHSLLLPCLCAFLISSPLTAYAGGLDDTSIRAVYDKSIAAVGNPGKSRILMEQKLGDHYLLKTELTQVINGAAPIISKTYFGKREVIENALRGYSVMQVEHYEKKITDIQYSADHLYAFVTSTTASSGKINIPGTNNGASAHYEDGEGCVDQLKLAKDKIKFVQSACNERFVVKK